MVRADASVHRDRGQLVGEGGGYGGVPVGQHRQTLAVGAVHRIEGLFRVEVKALHLREGRA